MLLVDAPGVVDNSDLMRPPDFEGDLYVWFFGGVPPKWAACGVRKVEAGEAVRANGLALFPSENQALRFSEHIGNAKGGRAVQVGFGEARSIALAKGLKALALIKNGDPKTAILHWLT